MVAALVALVVFAHYDVPRNAKSVQQLREHLLTGKDSFVPPSTDGKTGIQIGVQYRFFKVIKVDLASGQLLLKVWRRMSWADHRFIWDPADWDNITQVVMYPGAHSGGAMDTIDNNMWTPQIVLYNGITPQDQVMEEGAAWVTHTGAVWYSTPGVVDVSCRFSGLASFPFDELSCPIEIASWSYSDLVTNLTFMMDRPCVDLTTKNPTAGTTYAEYALKGFECYTNTVTYPCCADTPYTALIMRLDLKRSSFFYELVIIVPGILFTLLCCAPRPRVEPHSTPASALVCTSMILQTPCLCTVRHSPRAPP